ncbi:MAG: DUF2341 domain-containing protein, partial [Bacteroidales bacterium]|nr:DUF2341 domain-containing protein [Bacteroidales bacterium]
MKKILHFLWIFLFLLTEIGSAHAQGWYNSSWHYRKSHIINPASGAGTDYQVQITVHYGSGTDALGDIYCSSLCKTNFGDIRFTAADGTTSLSYWMQSSVASDNAVFWVKVSADLSSSAQTIYIYYGNSGVSTTSKGSSTFIYYDDGSSTTGWFISGDAGTTSSIGNPPNSLYAQTHTGSGQNYMSRNIGIAASTFTSCNVQTQTGNLGNFYYLCNSSGAGQMYRLDARGTTNYTGFATTTDWNTWNSPGESQTSSANTWYRFGIAINPAGTVSTLYYDATTSTNPVPGTILNSTTYGVTNNGGYVGLGGDALGGTVNTYWDNIITRKYVNPEPAHSTWGTQETNYYVWNNTTTDWTVANNWTPNRTNPTTYDVLQFSGGGNITVTNVPTQTIAQLILSNNSTVNLQSESSTTLTVNDALITTSGDVLNLGDLGAGVILGGTLTTLTNNGKIQTAIPTVKSATPIPAGKTWGGTVEYNGSGAQTAVGGTYTTLKINNSAEVTLAAAATITTLTIADVTSGSVFNDGGY